MSRAEGAGNAVRTDRNVLGGPLDVCSTRPMTGFFRDGVCRPGGTAYGGHTVAAVMTTEFLEHQSSVGNDLITPQLEYGFPGLTPGDRWCVLAARWLQSYAAGVAAPVVLSATHERALDVVPLEALRECAVDVPDDLSSLGPERGEQPERPERPERPDDPAGPGGTAPWDTDW
jgi:uncharacterized protein (DUF2237 family)